MNHEERDLDFVRSRLQSALPPIGDAGLQRDLWPRMAVRLDTEERVGFGWLEAALAAGIVLTVVAFPDLLPTLLCHL